MLKPDSKSISGKTLSLPAPTDGRRFDSAILLKGGHVVTCAQAAEGTVTLTLGADDNWDKLDTVMRLTIANPTSPVEK